MRTQIIHIAMAVNGDKMSHATITTIDPAVERSKELLERIFPSPRNFTIRLWNQEELPGESDSAFTLILKHPGALHRMFSPPLLIFARG